MAGIKFDISRVSEANQHRAVRLQALHTVSAITTLAFKASYEKNGPSPASFNDPAFQAARALTGPRTQNLNAQNLDAKRDMPKPPTGHNASAFGAQIKQSRQQHSGPSNSSTPNCGD